MENICNACNATIQIDDDGGAACDCASLARASYDIPSTWDLTGAELDAQRSRYRYACDAKACGASGLTLDETWKCKDCGGLFCDEHIHFVGGSTHVCAPCGVKRAVRNADAESIEWDAPREERFGCGYDCEGAA
jgi:hypothetical protein